MNKKRIFITGGASGLGKAIALKYAQAGYRVCIADINDERGTETLAQLNKIAPSALYLHCDITKIESLEWAKEQLMVNWSGVDIVVNNAGVGGNAGGIEDISLEDWHWVLNINLLGVVRGCKVFTPLFKLQGFGYFINIASMAGLVNAPNMSNYNVAKAGVISLSETLSMELAPNNIGVSVVCPAFFKTNLTESLKANNPKVIDSVNKLMDKATISANDVADAIYRGVEQQNFWLLPHKIERRLWLLKRYVPFVFHYLMNRHLARLSNKQPK
jgi:NAD(P)-dependent dehydrogenase (short-subunit alcohol dehydrogenase family)